MKLVAALCVLMLVIIGCGKQAEPQSGTQTPPAVTPPPAPANGGALTANDIDVSEVTDPTAGTTGSTPDITP